MQDILAARKTCKLLTLTFDDALRDGLYRKFCEKQGNEWSTEAEAKWRQEIIAFYGSAADEELFCIPPSAGDDVPELPSSVSVNDRPWPEAGPDNDRLRSGLLRLHSRSVLRRPPSGQYWQHRGCP